MGGRGLTIGGLTVVLGKFVLGGGFEGPFWCDWWIGRRLPLGCRLGTFIGHLNGQPPPPPTNTPLSIPTDSSQASLETHTPNIDKLYEEGIELDRHYTYKICSPSRSSLQSGRHPDHVNPLNTGVIVNNPDDPISGFQGIPRNMTGIAEKLKGQGYKTHMVGKWDAGMATPDHTPMGRGYDSFYGYFQHANGYWNKEGHIESTGDVDLCMNMFTDLFMENATYRGGVLESGELDDSCSGSNEEVRGGEGGGGGEGATVGN